MIYYDLILEQSCYIVWQINDLLPKKIVDIMFCMGYDFETTVKNIYFVTRNNQINSYSK